MESSVTIQVKKKQDGITICNDCGQEWKFNRSLTAMNALCILLADTITMKYDCTNMYSSEFEITMKVTQKD